MKSKVLMIGAAGGIGRKIVPLLSPSFDLFLADRKSEVMDGQDVRALDITNLDEVRAAMRGMDAVVHLAIASQCDYITDRANFLRDQGEDYLRFNEAMIDVNVRGTYHVFEAAREAGVKRVIFISSLTIYLGQPRYEAVHDDLPPRPSNIYAVTKLWGEQLGEYFSRRDGTTVYCLRYGDPYPQNIPSKIEAWKKKPPGQLLLVTYEDIAGSIEAALTKQGGPAFGAYTILSACDDPVFDSSKAAEIGWKPKTRCEADGSITRIL